MMLSVQTGLNSQSAALSQTPSSPLGPASQNEEKKKQSHIPTVEVSAAQAQSLSPRVGDFLANQAGKPSNAAASSSGPVAPTGVDGAAPAAAVATDVMPSTPSDDGGSSAEGQQDQAALAYSLLQSNETVDAKSARNRDVSADEEASERDENDGDADDVTYTASQQPARSALEDLPPVPPAGMGTIVNTNQSPIVTTEAEDKEPEFSDQQRGGENREGVDETGEAKETAKRDQKPDHTPYATSIQSGDFSLYFDEAGTYQMAAA